MLGVSGTMNGGGAKEVSKGRPEVVCVGAGLVIGVSSREDRISLGCVSSIGSVMGRLMGRLLEVAVGTCLAFLRGSGGRIRG
eukprot:scaffold1029_cov164-Ochromonas_danica.AAC.5